MAMDIAIDYHGRIMLKTVRSPFWVVSTHVLTAGMAVPLCMTLFALVLIVKLDLHGLPALVVSLGCQTAGYIGGTYASLFLLRKRTLIRNPTRCTKPAVIVFVVLELFTATARVLTATSNSAESILLVFAFYAVIAVAVACITRYEFAAWEAASR